MDEKKAYCSNDVMPEASGDCMDLGGTIPEDVKEVIVAEKPDLKDVGLEDTPIGEEEEAKET